MKHADNIKRLIKNEKIKTSPAINEAVFNDLADKLDKAQSAQTNTNEPNIWRIIMKNKKFKMAIAAMIIIAVMLGIHLSGGSIDGSRIAWADVIKPIMNATTASMEIVIGETIIYDKIKDNKILRTVPSQNDAEIVIDLDAMQLMTIDKSEKTVTFIKLDGLGEIPNYLEHLQTLITKLQTSPEFSVEEQGTQTYQDKDYVVFLASSAKDTISIWVNPDTAAPVRIIQDTPNMKIACENLLFNIELDSSLFSMEVPEGYKTMNAGIDFKNPSESAFIESLRTWATIIEDNQFPDSINIEDFVKIGPKFEKGLKKAGLNDEQQLEVATKFGQGIVFIRFFNGQGKWHYAGKGVTFGDGQTPIFWYQPKDSDTWHVIYGDLSVKDTAQEDLPQK